MPLLHSESLDFLQPTLATVWLIMAAADEAVLSLTDREKERGERDRERRVGLGGRQVYADGEMESKAEGRQEDGLYLGRLRGRGREGS